MKTPEEKALLLKAIKESLAKSNAGVSVLGNVEVNDTISLIDMITASTNPRINITPENPQYVFESTSKKRFSVSGNGIPTMRVIAEGKDQTVLGNATTVADLRTNADVIFFKQALESLDEGKAIDITNVKFRCVAKLAQNEAVDTSKPAMLPSCYKKYDDYLAEVREANADFQAARVRLHNSGLKPEFASKQWSNTADRVYFQQTPVFQVSWQ